MKEHDIRPRELFQRYLDLSQKDANCFRVADFKDIHCPGCLSDNAEKRFKKNGFQYVFCRDCGSLYCSPRPNENELDSFYRTSESAKYWAEIFFPAVAEKRREKIFRKKAKQVHDALAKKNCAPGSVCDVGAGYGIFLEELQAFFPESTFSAIEPGPDLAAQCRSKGFETLQKTAEQSVEWASRFDLVISSEVIEHVYSTTRFISSLFCLTKPDGFCLTTGLGYEGFDILTLQEESNSVFPPHHLNFLSVEGFEILFKNTGFSHVEVCTPGELDVDIVENSPVVNEFVRVLSKRGSQASKEFQNFLKKQNLSSHVWILAQK